jgi:quercetin dioxygenase-like cupin family protein
MTRQTYRFDAIEWHVPSGPGTDPDVAQASADAGVGRKYLAQGDAGFFAQIVRFPPNFETPAHSHDHAEVFVVLDGDCSFDGEPMSRHDCTVIEANETYGFTAGTDGLLFLVVRTGKATFAPAES